LGPVKGDFLKRKGREGKNVRCPGVERLVPVKLREP